MSLRKKIYYFISFLILVVALLIALGWYDVRKGASFKINYFLGTELRFPSKLVTILKNTIFIVPTLQKTVEEQRTQINRLKNLRRHALELWYVASAGDFEKISSIFFDKKNIKSNSGVNNYEAKLFSLPFHNYVFYAGEGYKPIYIPYTMLVKPVAYLDQSEDQIFLVSGNGVFFSFTKNRITELAKNRNMTSKFNKLELKKIKTNIRDLIKNEKYVKNAEFYLDGYPGIRDILILDNKIFFSYNKIQIKECYSTSIMVAELNINNLNFSEFFTYDECVSKDNQISKDSNASKLYDSGGKMFSFKNNKILLTIGTYGDRPRAQKKDSFFGKIISIDLVTKDHELISMGHRNPQGLYYDEDSNVIVSTEHGPRGGDEININLEPGNEVENYGWPISSYGEHYDKEYKEDAPLHKSHKKFGFTEPIKYFTPSIGISDVIKIPKTFNEKFINDFFVASMGSIIGEGDLSIHHIRLNKDFDKIEFEDIIPLGQRIRDMIFVREQNIVLLVLENTPAIAILKLKNI